jgi:lipopolysaccharide transport system permease protein
MLASYVRNLVGYRELLYFLVLREIKAKYKQTALGIIWSLLQPLAMLTVFTVVFSHFAQLPSDGKPYAVFAYCALLPWQFFAGVLSRGIGSLLSNQNLVQKVYFPREIIPLAMIGAAMVDFLIGGLSFFGLLLYYGSPLNPYWLVIIPVFLIQVLFMVGLVLLLSPLNVFYRDISHIVPLFMQIWMYATPIIYPISLVPERLRPLYYVNPMVGIIDAYRKILLHQALPDMVSLAIAGFVAAGTVVLGLMYFKRVEFKLADVL